MNFILANIIMELKVLLKDKISLLWSIIVPLGFFFNYREFATRESNMTIYYSYIAITSYIFGVALFVLDERESGNLRLMFSISNNPVGYFFSNLFTQFIFSFISMSLLNIVVCVLNGLNIFILTMYSILVIFACIPVAFLFYNLTLIKKVYPGTIKTAIYILLMVLFLGANSRNDSVLLLLNPFVMIPGLFIVFNRFVLGIYIAVSGLIILLSLYSVFNFEPIENERR